MAAIVKTKLKAARDATNLKDWKKAKAAASATLDYDPENYMAYVDSCASFLLGYRTLGKIIAGIADSSGRALC